MLLLVFIGLPGSGKGSQANIIANNHSFEHIAMGDLLRNYLKKDGEKVKHLQKLLAQGNLIPDATVNNIINDELSHLKANSSNVILDGYPRSMKQVQYLKENNYEKFIKVIHFDIDKDILVKRITGRFNCAECGAIYNQYLAPPIVEGVCDTCKHTEFVCRKDDNVTSLKQRLHEYA